MENTNKFRLLTNSLTNPALDTSNALTQLKELATIDGVSLRELSSLLDLVFEPLVSSMIRNRLLDDCMISRGDYIFPANVLSRVLGIIGAPEIYYKNGKQHKSKRFSIPTQQKILSWTVSNLPFFGHDLYRTLNRSLPILFGLLSYEFSRHFIVTLIIVATRPEWSTISRQNSPNDFNKQTRPLLRHWHAQLVVDLLERFPLDASLNALALHISQMESLSISRRMFKFDKRQMLSRSREGVYIPNSDFVLSNCSRFPANEFSKEIMKIHKIISRIYKVFERTLKRRKLDNSSDMSIDVLNSSFEKNQVAINSIDSVDLLISNFEKVFFINPSSILTSLPSMEGKIRNLYVSLVLFNAGPSHQVHKKLATGIRHHAFSGISEKGKFERYSIDVLAKFGTLTCFGVEIDRFVSNSIHQSESGLSSLGWSLHMLPYLHAASEESITQSIFQLFRQLDNCLITKWSEIQPVLPMMMLNLTVFIRNFMLPGHKPLSKILNMVVPETFDIMDKYWAELSLSAKLSCLMFMNHAISLADRNASSSAFSAIFVPKPSLLFRLVLSTSPIVVSETLGFIASLKKLKLADANDVKSLYKNSYVMDSINFIWRDMAFKYDENSINRGMCLHPLFIQRMSGLDYFSNSNLISIKSVGGIIHNPAFAYLCAELVWQLEDQRDELTTRHPGPISEDTVAQMSQDKDTKWLDLSYQELKINILNHLDAMGFRGLADLLFTSLKPLVNQRTRKGYSNSVT